MGLRDVLFGRKRLKEAKRDALFALPSAAVSMEVELGLRPAGVAAVVFKPLSAGEFVRAENEMQELLDVAARESSSRVERRSDDYGYEWLIIRDEQFEDLVTTVHLVAGELAERGFGPQLLAAVTRFDGGSIPPTSSTATSAARSAVRADRGARARQRRGAGAEGEAGERAAHRAGHPMWFALYGLPI